MELRTVGRSGLQVSVLGLGCNNFGSRIDEEAARAVVKTCLEAGVTFFDTADIYGGGQSEEFLGRALEGHRDDVVVATKFALPTGEGPYRSGASRKYVVAASPIEETLDTLDVLVREGKVRYAASSNFAGWQVGEAEHVARERHTARYVATQAQWSLLERGIEAEVVPACAAYDIGVVPYYPLASGLLTGKYERGKPAPDGTRLASSARYEAVATDAAFDKVERLDKIAKRAGRSLLDLAIGWLAAQPVVPSVLVGATRPEQVAANAAAAEVTLSGEELSAISDATAPATR